MPETYGFKIEVSGNAITSITALDKSMTKLEVDSKSLTSGIAGHFTKLGDKIKSIFGGWKGLIGGATGLGFLFGGVELAKSSLEAFDKRQEALTKLRTVIQSTGGAAGFTAEQLDKMSDVQSKGVLFTKSSIGIAEIRAA